MYIPLLPRTLIDFLFAPMPFIIGMHHAYVKGQLIGELMHDLVIVDLDANRVTFHGQAGTGKLLPQFPVKERKKLRKGLHQLQLFKAKEQRSEYEKRMQESMDDAFIYAPSPDEIEQLMASQERADEQLRRILEQESGGKSPISSTAATDMSHEQFISALFFRAFTSLLKDYRSYLIRPTEANPHPDPCFNRRGFLKHHDSSSHVFLNDLISSQAFTAFCEERIYSTHTTPHNTRFFDESITAKKNRSRLTRSHDTPFLSDTRFVLRETYVVPAADVTGCKGLYRYDVWPRLDVKLFPLPRRIPSFQSKRQSSLSFIAGTERPPGAGSTEGTVRFSASTPATLEQVLYTVWFMLVCGIASQHSIPHLINTAIQGAL